MMSSKKPFFRLLQSGQTEISSMNGFQFIFFLCSISDIALMKNYSPPASSRVAMMLFFGLCFWRLTYLAWINECESWHNQLLLGAVLDKVSPGLTILVRRLIMLGSYLILLDIRLKIKRAESLDFYNSRDLFGWIKRHNIWLFNTGRLCGLEEQSPLRG